MTPEHEHNLLRAVDGPDDMKDLDEGELQQLDAIAYITKLNKGDFASGAYTFGEEHGGAEDEGADRDRLDHLHRRPPRGSRSRPILHAATTGEALGCRL